MPTLVEITADPIDWAGWAQAVFGAGAILATWFLASRDARRARTRDRAQQQAVESIVEVSLAALHGFNTKAKSGAFTSGNIGASEDAAEAAVATLSSLPLLELNKSQIEAVSEVRRHLTTARRRLGFVRGDLRKGIPSAHRFDGLYKQVGDALVNLRAAGPKG